MTAARLFILKNGQNERRSLLPALRPADEQLFPHVHSSSLHVTATVSGPQARMLRRLRLVNVPLF